MHGDFGRVFGALVREALRRTGDDEDKALQAFAAMAETSPHIAESILNLLFELIFPLDGGDVGQFIDSDGHVVPIDRRYIAHVSDDGAGKVDVTYRTGNAYRLIVNAEAFAGWSGIPVS